jgi:glycogen debranching enzyme
MKWFSERKNKRGLFTAREFLIHLDNPMRYQVCQGATVNAFIYKALTDASYLAGELGRKVESDRYKQEAERLKSAFNCLMWDKNSGSFYSAVYYPDFSEGERLPELKLVPVEDPASVSTKWHDGNVQWIEKDEKIPPTVQAALVALNKEIVSDEHISDVRKYLITHSGELKNPFSEIRV